MTPERWRQIGELFDAAVRIDPAGREDWLRAACGGDDELRAEVGRLLAQDERADRVGLLAPPRLRARPRIGRRAGFPGRSAPPPGPGPAAAAPGRRPTTPAASPRGRRSRRGRGEPRSPSPRRSCGAAARAADDLHPDPGGCVLLEAGRLRPGDTAYFRANATVILALVGLVALLWSRWSIPLAGLKALELGLVGLLAGYFAWLLYRVTLESSVGGDRCGCSSC